MKSLFKLFFSPAGRIGRARFWLGFVAVLALIVAGMIANDPKSFSDNSPVTPLVPMGINEAMFIAIATIMIAILGIKRFNDRDWPWWTGYVIGVLGLAEVAGEYFFGFMHDMDHLTRWESAAFAASIGLFLFQIVENGFFRGTNGPNRYGPNPVRDKNDDKSSDKSNEAGFKHSSGSWAD